MLKAGGKSVNTANPNSEVLVIHGNQIMIYDMFLFFPIYTEDLSDSKYSQKCNYCILPLESQKVIVAEGRTFFLAIKGFELSNEDTCIFA